MSSYLLTDNLEIDRDDSGATDDSMEGELVGKFIDLA